MAPEAAMYAPASISRNFLPPTTSTTWTMASQPPKAVRPREMAGEPLM